MFIDMLETLGHVYSTPWGCLMFIDMLETFHTLGMSDVYRYAGNISYPGDV